MFLPSSFLRPAFQKRARGFALIELIVALAVVAILATISTLSYRSFAKSKDISNGQQYLFLLMQKQEVFFQNKRRYANNVDDLSLPARPPGSENAFKDVKIFVVYRNEAGRDYYSAVLDPQLESTTPPLVVSETGERFFEYSSDCYQKAGVGKNASDLDPETATSYERAQAVAYCRFTVGDKRWDEKVNEQQTEQQTGAVKDSEVKINFLQHWANSVPSIGGGDGSPLASLPSEFCDVASKNQTIPAEATQNFEINNSIQSCSCPGGSAQMRLDSTSGKVVCVKYSACGEKQGQYLEENKPASCHVRLNCSQSGDTQEGATNANQKIGPIYADPNNTGYEDGYMVWCSNKAVLNIDYVDPTKSTCMAAVCDGSGSLKLQTSAANHEVSFSCLGSLGSSYPSSSMIAADTNGDQYLITCPEQTTMNFNALNFYESSCSKGACDKGVSSTTGNTVPATVK